MIVLIHVLKVCKNSSITKPSRQGVGVKMRLHSGNFSGAEPKPFLKIEVPGLLLKLETEFEVTSLELEHLFLKLEPWSQLQNSCFL